jgi:hypothetical protein
MKKLGIAILTLLVVGWAALCIASAWAHGDAQWIADGGYKSASGSTCCGISDCHMVKGAAYHRVENGWTVDVVINEKPMTLFAPDASVHASKDNEVWFCALPQDYLDGKARCLFIPGSV